jgi:hypothetical protein
MNNELGYFNNSDNESVGQIDDSDFNSEENKSELKFFNEDDQSPQANFGFIRTCPDLDGDYEYTDELRMPLENESPKYKYNSGGGHF